MSIAKTLKFDAYPYPYDHKLGEFSEQVGGIEWRNVITPDAYTNDNNPEALELRSRILRWNEELIADPSLQLALTVDETGELFHHNHISEAVFSHSAMHNWRSKLVPSAMALYPLQRPNEKQLPNGFDIDPESQKFYLHSADAVGIRSRASVFTELSFDVVDRLPLDHEVRWASAASGAAVPVVDALSRIGLERRVNLDLIDIDVDAHSMAAGLLAHANLDNVSFTTHTEDIIRGLVLRDSLIADLDLEAKFDVVDGLGIFEYIGKRNLAAKFARNLYRMVRPGGSLIIGNMLDTHPQLAFNKYGIGWPGITPRSREELADILTASGIPAEHVTAYVPGDGIYAAIEAKKPEKY